MPNCNFEHVMLNSTSGDLSISQQGNQHTSLKPEFLCISK